VTTKEMATFIGREAQWKTNGLSISVTVVDVKQAWGKLRYQISPVSGNGATWVEYLDVPDPDDFDN
jgi:hypothetical protein